MTTIYTFVSTSSLVKPISDAEFQLNKAGSFAVFYCPPEYSSVHLYRAKVTVTDRKLLPDETKTEFKEYTLTSYGGETKKFKNEEDDQKNIDITITLGAFIAYVPAIDPDTGDIIPGEYTTGIAQHPTGGTGGAGSTIYDDKDPPPGDDEVEEPSNWGFYLFLFAVLAMVVVGGYLWYKKKLPFQSDSIIADVKEGEGEGEE